MSFSSLQVFENESHASVHSDKTKEGLSLFGKCYDYQLIAFYLIAVLGILNGTKTTLGRSLLRTWLLRPSLSIPTINARHNAVGCFLRSENIATATQLHNHLKGIKNMPRIMNQLRDGKGRISEWQGLVKVRILSIYVLLQISSTTQFTFHATMLRDSLSELHQASQVDVISKVPSLHDFFLLSHINIARAYWRAGYRKIQRHWRQSQQHCSCSVPTPAAVTVDVLPDRLGRVV